MVKMMDIKILTAFSILFISLMVSNEFLEFLVNIIYTAILFIIVLFFYQNKHHFIDSPSSSPELFDINNTTSTTITNPNINKKEIVTLIEKTQDDSIIVKEQSPGEVKLIYNYSKEDNDQQILIKQLQTKSHDLSEQLNKSVERSREEQLKYFNELNKYQMEIKELKSKSGELLNSIAILNSTIEGQRQNISDLTKERDSIYLSEQKVVSKLTEYEKKEKNHQENEKQSNKKISELKDQVSLFKKEVDEKVKKISKLETQVTKLEKEKSKLNSNISDTSSNSSVASSSSGFIPSSSPSKGIPIPISSSHNRSNSNGSNSGFVDGKSSASPSSSYLRDASASDEDSFSSSSEGKPFKSLFNKVKSESSKFVEKAQKGINKHLGSDFFNQPPTNNNGTQPQTPTHNNNNIPPVIIKESPNKSNQILFDLENDKLLDNGAQQSIQPTKVSPRDQIQKEQSLSDLFIKSSNVSFSNLDSFLTKNSDQDVNNSNNNNESEINNITTTNLDDLKFEDLNNNNNNIKEEEMVKVGHSTANESDVSKIKIQTIKEFSIKADENKNGLRRAKKKPSPGSSTMMEDVSIAKYPFFETDEDLGLFGVFDGHAGRGAADSASKLFPLELEKLMKEQDNYLEDDQSQLINKAFKNVDNQMKDHEYEGCTATISLIWKTKDNQRYLQVGNVGDSSAFLCRNGQAIELTLDHKANDPSEKQRMIDSGIPVGENQTRINGVAVSRSLGNHFIKEQNIGMISDPHISNCYLLTDQDKFLIIASDGLWDVIKGQEAVEKLLENYNSSSADSMASLLLENAVQSSMCKDNVSVIVVKL
ncbi:hypothetical protein DICPUDRAFT_157361 [Dictyostelium purpureum]|uniref:PPM-type phosphatase domain-containing protein n=1 Tax=Dictyostelium purpureum TaxID=5786 RepID=F0ZYY0_DICPU|nr:uncharacterized protein DICPUDRAFT_157361 [Dictyostelium purpureum]EGC30859.1 hypothetical protein DICPUDRAFT_157361 [Dictyostelium purpureum]|eukprot:XP_003292625.1 hypothetical protein DICPUDRAFT_157361 [Dictyostelium purpureum]